MRFILRENFGWNLLKIRPVVSKVFDSRGRRYVTTSDIEWYRRRFPSIKALTGHYLRAFGYYNKLNPKPFIFTFLRDPLKRMVSQYNYQYFRRQGKIDPIEKWLEIYPAYQTMFLSDQTNPHNCIELLEKVCDFVGITEDFDLSLFLLRHEILKKLSLDIKINYQRRNVTPQKKIEKIEINGQVAKLWENGDYILYNYFKKKLYYMKANQNISDEEIIKLKKESENFRYSKSKILQGVLAHKIVYNNLPLLRRIGILS